jgi:hypothetical protein
MSQLSLDISERFVVHCMKDDYDVYIGRGRCPKTGQQGEWGNPFSHESNLPGVTKVASRTVAIAAYHDWLIAQPELVKKAKRELKGKKLGCWCAPRACHGAVLAGIANAM